jgi:hypothetical protein
MNAYRTEEGYDLFGNAVWSGTDRPVWTMSVQAHDGILAYYSPTQIGWEVYEETKENTWKKVRLLEEVDTFIGIPGAKLRWAKVDGEPRFYFEITDDGLDQRVLDVIARGDGCCIECGTFDALDVNDPTCGDCQRKRAFKEGEIAHATR